ncbi:MAG: toprim domain-containing protein [Candidatus Bathyarchaeota archaeon]|nr:toprim domain-containing protein [Candidatus Bathyarchaeota archaeon]
MSTHLEEKRERILEIINALAEESAKGTPIVVEGRKDAETLRKLGVAGTVITAKTGGKTFLDTVSEIEQTEAAEVILLLDFDRRGKQGTKLLKQHLEHAKIKPNTTFWRSLSAWLGKEIQCIEDITTYMVTLQDKIDA